VRRLEFLHPRSVSPRLHELRDALSAATRPSITSRSRSLRVSSAARPLHCAAHRGSIMKNSLAE
jgi:hypothetical protein